MKENFDFKDTLLVKMKLNMKTDADLSILCISYHMYNYGQ